MGIYLAPISALLVPHLFRLPEMSFHGKGKVLPTQSLKGMSMCHPPQVKYTF